MLVGFVFVLSLVHWTEQHLLFPINFCNMAAACIHDNRMVCASTPDGCSRRTFLDQCDMYEFNCDYGTRYTDTNMMSCKESECQLCQETSKITDPVTRHTTTPTPWTTKPSTTIKTTMVPTRITSRLTTTTRSPITTTSIPRTTTVQGSTETDSCCDRPGSWKTTIEDNKPFSFRFETVQGTTEIILPSTTTASTTSYTEKPLIIIMKTVQPTTTVDDWPTIQPAMKIPENKPCCDRPGTWSTTTESVIPYVAEDKNVSVEDNEILDDPPLIGENIPFDISSEIDELPEALSSIEPPSPSSTVPPSKTVLPSTTLLPSASPSEPPPPIYSSFEENVPQKLIQLDSEDSDRLPNKIIYLQTKKTSKPTETWWYPTICPGSRCERPQVWSTTRSRKTRRWNGGGWK